MAWIRETDERAERRAGDAVHLIVAAIGVAVVGMWAQTQSTVDVNLFATLNGLGDDLVNVAKGVYALGSIWTVVALALLLLVTRHLRMAWRTALAGAAAYGLALVSNDILGDHVVSTAAHVRVGDGPSYPVANVAVVAALTLALAPFVVRPLRRALWVLVILVMAAALYLGAGYPSDVLGGLLLGVAVVALIRVVWGSPAGEPTTAEVRDVLTELGIEVREIAYAPQSVPRASVMDVVLDSGDRVRVDAFGRDQRDAQLAARVWHRLMYREPGLAVFGSGRQHVEHIGFALVLAERAGVGAARYLQNGVGGADTAILVTAPPAGTPLAALPPERVTDDVISALWVQLHDLHAAGLSHGNLDPQRVLVSDDGVVAFDDFSAAAVAEDCFWRNRDNAALVVQTALIAGNDRAVAAALAALDKERVADLIPLVQPAALPKGVGEGVDHFGKTLKALRTDLATAAGVEDVQTLKIRRLDWASIGITIGVLIALVIAFRSLEGVNWASVQSEFQHATWGWAVLALILYPLVPISWAIALMGCVVIDLPFIPTVLTQNACSFLNLITPNGIGGTALQVEYLHKEGIPVASGGSAMVLSTGVGGAIQILLFLGAAAITASTIDTQGSSDSSGGNALIVIAVIAAVLGIVLLVPKVRGKVVPAARRALLDIWTVIRNPKKALFLIGGDTGGNIIYPCLLGLCLLAFHQHLDFAQVVVVQIGAGMVGNIAPVPGGIGVTEAALTGLLTGFGVPAAPALASVLVFRGISFALPPVFGFFTLRWLRAKGYA